MSSSPFRYVRFSDTNVVTYDINAVDVDSVADDAIVLVGGGGLIDCLDRWNVSLGRLLARQGPTIGWGLGVNRHYDAAIAAPLDVRRFALLGIRDVAPDLAWVPCASCLMPAFDQRYVETRDVGIFWHKDQPLDARLREFDMRTNRCSPEEAVRFLATSETVVTNSYHGLYWATLLSRRVFLHRPFSTKFEGLPFNVARFDGSVDRDTCVSEYDGLLARCRDRTLWFAARVRQFLDKYDMQHRTPALQR